MPFGPVDWAAVLTPDKPFLEIVVRGSLVYIAAFLLLRILKREAGTLSVTDLIVVVFLADAAQNAMGGAYQSVPDGILLMAVIVSWAYLFDVLSYYHPWFARMLTSPPLPLVVDGRMLPHNMRKEFITPDELLSQLRLQGIDDISEIRRANIEPDGRISAIQRTQDRHDAPERGGGE